MAANKKFNFGPVYLSSTLTTNILNPTTSTGGTNSGSSSQYIIISHFHISNTSGSAATVTLYKGATGANAAGTEVLKGYSVAANSEYNYYGVFRFDAADFLVGGSGTNNVLTIAGEGEIGVAG